jgi:acylphosphatase
LPVGCGRKTLPQWHGCGFIARAEYAAGAGLAPWHAANPGETGKPMNRTRMQVLYSGRVQGVGFRYTAKTVAMGFEVTGTVRNLPDGRVELNAEGSREELEAFCQAVRDSGLEGFIREELVSWHPATGEFRGFEIVR